MSIVGSIVTAWDVEQAVKATLQTWLDTYLTDCERQSGGRWAIRSIRRPPNPEQSWEIVSAYHDIPGRILPAISIESGAMATDPDVEAEGDVTGRWAITVQAVVKGKSRGLARDVLSMYEAAIRTIFQQKGSLDGFADGTVLGRSNLNLIPPDRDRTLVGCEVPLTVIVPQTNFRGPGPEEPDPTPDPPPISSPDDPNHTSTNVVLTPE